MEKKRLTLLVFAVLTVVMAVPLVYTMTPVNLTAKAMVSEGNVTPTYPTEVGPGKWALANFSGMFWVTVARESGRITLSTRPSSGYKLEEIKVVVPMKYGANLEVRPPLVGKTEIYHEGDLYVIDSKDFGNLGEGQIVLTLFEGIPKKSAIMKVYVKAKRGLRSYTGEWSFFIMNSVN